MNRKGIQYYIDTFRKICTRERKNRYEAHAIAHPYLYRLAKEGMPTIYEILKMAMLSPGFFHKKEASHSFQINLSGNPEHEFYCSFFAPLENRDTSYSYSPMHTHGDYMLSTINTFGEGYTSLIWQKGWTIDAQTNEVEMKLQKYCRHKYMNIEFIDANTAHTVFYPEKICITYAFWTHSKETNWINKMRGFKIVQKNKEMLKKIIRAFVSSPEKVGLVVHKENYFYPKNGKLYAASDREIQPSVSFFPQNFFSIVQELGFNDISFLEDMKNRLSKEDMGLIQPWLDKFLSGEKIPLNYEGYNTHHPRRNVHIDEFRKLYDFKLE